MHAARYFSEDISQARGPIWSLLISRQPNYGDGRRKIRSGQRTARAMSDPSIKFRSSAALGRLISGGGPRDPRRARAGVYFHKESEIAGGKACAPPDIIIAMTGAADATVRERVTFRGAGTGHE